VEKVSRSFADSLKERSIMSEIRELPIDEIKVGEHDKRLGIDEGVLADLVSSIGSVGMLYPCVVVKRDDGYLMLDGHTRLEACKRLGKTTVECTIAGGDASKDSEIALAGNFFRKDFTPVELAAAIRDAFKSGAMTVEKIAKGFHRSEHWVQSMMAICDWPADVQVAMHTEGISVSAAANLAQVTDEVYRIFLISNAVEGGVSARTTAAWLQAWRSMRPMEEAVTSEPVEGRPPPQPAPPQAPCFMCTAIFYVNEMSHVPLCGSCIQEIRKVQ